MRNIFEVISKIKEVVPADEVGFHAELNWAREDVAYKAPEIQWMAWESLAKVFNRNINVPFEECNEWQKKAVLIFTDKEAHE